MILLLDEATGSHLTITDSLKAPFPNDATQKERNTRDHFDRKKKPSMHNTGTISGPAQLLAVVCVSKHLSNCPVPLTISLDVCTCGGDVIYKFMLFIPHTRNKYIWKTSYKIINKKVFKYLEHFELIIIC